MISVLFIKHNSVYKSFGRCNCFDEKRNALSCPGDQVTIAHPPCRLFSKCSPLSTAPEQEIYLGFFALEQVRKNGGILEQPQYSKLWELANLPKGNEIDSYGGWTLSINQSWFGHRARKTTWLYIVGLSPGEVSYPISFNRPVVSVEKMCKAERERTPILFAKWLYSLSLVIEARKK